MDGDERATPTREISAADRQKPRGPGACDQSAAMIPESLLMEWTDEKHNLYLNSIETSFINQLYSTKFGSRKHFGWLQKDINASGSNSNYMLYGQNWVNLGVLAEVSDQNFVDMDPKEENLNRSISRKRAKHEHTKTLVEGSFI